MTFAEVLLWGTKIGTVALPDDSHIATFRYDNDFLTDFIHSVSSLNNGDSAYVKGNIRFYRCEIEIR